MTRPLHSQHQATDRPASPQDRLCVHQQSSGGAWTPQRASTCALTQKLSSGGYLLKPLSRRLPCQPHDDEEKKIDKRKSKFGLRTDDRREDFGCFGDSRLAVTPLVALSVLVRDGSSHWGRELLRSLIPPRRQCSPTLRQPRGQDRHKVATLVSAAVCRAGSHEHCLNAARRVRGPPW